MKSILGTYGHLWPKEVHAELSPVLNSTPTLLIPSKKKNPLKDPLHQANLQSPKTTVLVFEDAPIKELIEYLGKGFEHCVHMERPDFGPELLVSALMVERPEAFKRDPIPFFLNGFQIPVIKNVDTHLLEVIKASEDKQRAIENLEAFLTQTPKLDAVKDLCVQIADELLMNAIYSAPYNMSGERPHQHIDRTQRVVLPENKHARLFSCFSDYRLVIGCEDQYGSLNRKNMLDSLARVYQTETSAVKEGKAGAGIGFRYIIDNAANFYVYVDSGKRTLVACSLLLKGVRANLMAKKHCHVSFR